MEVTGSTNLFALKIVFLATFVAFRQNFCRITLVLHTIAFLAGHRVAACTT